MTTSDKLILEQLYLSMYDDTLEEGLGGKLAGAGLATMAAVGGMKGYDAMKHAAHDYAADYAAQPHHINGDKETHIFINHPRLKVIIGDYLKSKNIQFDNIEIKNDKIEVSTKTKPISMSIPKLRHEVRLTTTMDKQSDIASYIYNAINKQ
jgi:hypothetical protein